MAILKGTTEIDGAQQYIKTTKNGELVTTDIARMWTAKGYGRQAMSTAAVACVIVRPTTTAIASLYNTGQNNLVIERVFAHNLVSIANGQFSIWLCVHPKGTIVAAYANDITARAATSGNAVTDDAYWDIEDTVVDAGWFPWGVSQYSVTATVPGTVAEADIRGRIIIPPTAGLSISCVGQTAVVTVCVGAHWFSVPQSEFPVV